MENLTLSVVILYSKIEIITAKRIKENIQRQNVQIWMLDEYQLPGRPWKYELENAIKGANVVLVLFSSESLGENGKIPIEISHGLDYVYKKVKNIKVLPIRLNDCLPEHHVIKDIQFIDLFPIWELGIKNIDKQFPISSHTLKVNNSNIRLSILILAANPKDTPVLRLDEEVREISNGLKRSKYRDNIVLNQQWASRPIDVRRAMLDYKPNIVHFIGHGSGNEGIALENDSGLKHFVNAETLANFFKVFSNNLQCVVLNSCYSKNQAIAIGSHIDYVIGMEKEIEDSISIEFSVSLYDCIGAGESIEFAYQLACSSIEFYGNNKPLLAKPIFFKKGMVIDKF